MLRTDMNPTVDPRFEREGDWEALQFFNEAERALSPEEYAARHGHEWGCFSFHLYRYRDEKLGNWVRQVGELLGHPDELDKLRERLLTQQERAEILRRQSEAF